VRNWDVSYHHAHDGVCHSGCLLYAAADLSNVEYMPAYLNKRLNNRLWSRRKAQQAC
jgi:hypothetical protein